MAETLSGQTPIFGGSTGGLLTKAEREEKYAITWTAPKDHYIELPTGGTALARQGQNLLYLARKEYAIFLGGQQLRKQKITDYKIYRIYPNGEIQYIHPADGVFPEKVNPGREKVRYNDRRIGQNPSQSKVKFSGVATYDAP
ncbi:photosystem I reaction center subunit II [Aetokthonos hydrillicola Thurmond2011]|jgi:photosystem I subunit 2|uniref:Photosystem I reaction center subunit II n=1 Tax=Aetokthonos hydrillicola Thurmond2011 TaxID=2712845 RepID=A0AAP5I9C7_9CYAN|nr:photosystem I reaction center subunit II PsaD [Aetokthonos hydrillicola]MBO3460762.1 Photosystem I reaction center subunit II [Aetokthonos hydrillicola CCALA 1050]MBW4585359.1 photosystem I reaction center subunit II [Aetokthonos hydrillicola CCALA 1050]MDR9897296.1 photosystem I reaction center subunit II [Aetokthonos hydrillicola Thurmond2011]